MSVLLQTLVWVGAGGTASGTLWGLYMLIRKIDETIEIVDTLRPNEGISIHDKITRIDKNLTLHLADPHAHTVLGTPVALDREETT